MLVILAMGSDFRCSVGTVKSVGLEDHNKKGRAARYGEARRWWDLNDDTGASRCERIFDKINLGEKLLMSIASNMCNFKMEKMSDDARLDKGIE